MNRNIEILKKFIGDQSQRLQDDISKQGYKDNSPYRNNPSNTIYGTPQGTPITMKGVSTPLIGMDEFGNKQYMQPGQEYQFPGSQVTETRTAKYGGLLNKTVTCPNCGWSWKAADGGNDVSTCHKCGAETNELLKAQYGNAGNDVVNWTKDYVNSPKYKERITKSGYDDPDKQVLKRLQNLENVNFIDKFKSQGTVFNPNNNTVETNYPADIEYYNIHKNLYPTKPELNSIIAHELGHSETNRRNSGSSLLNKYDTQQLKNRLLPSAYDDQEVFINNTLKHDASHHNVIPEENKADLNSFRYDLRNQYDAGKQDFTEDYLKNSPDSFAKERLLKNYSKEDLIWLMNNVAQNDSHNNQMPIAQLGGSDFWKTDRKAFVDSTLTAPANKNLDFVKRLYDQSKGSIQIPGVPGRSTHYMADDKNRVYPTVVNKNGKLTYLSNPDQAWDYANDNKEYIDFKTPEQASWFANSPNHNTGYKMGTNVLTEIPRRQMGGAGMMTADRDYQVGGYTRPLVENTQVGTARDKRGFDLQMKEHQDALKDEHELQTIGQIKIPRSVKYKQSAPKIAEVRQSVPQSTGSKAWEVATHPTTALGYAVRNEDLPDNFSRGPINAHEQAVNLINPAFYANEGLETLSSLSENHPLDAAGHALNFVPALAEFGPELRSIKTSIAPELRQGLRTAGPSFISSVENTGNISKNLEDLNFAKKWAKQYGYTLPENFQRIAQSDELTDRTVRGLANRHNTFVRGVSTNWEHLGQKNPEILKHIEQQGFNLATDEGSKQAAEYMATHIPINTGYGRFGLKEGENALYLSNSSPTAEGYTYGNGYVVKTKKPTDFSSANRNEWLTNNDFNVNLGFKNSPFGKGVVKNDYIKRFPKTLRETLAITGDPTKMVELQNAVKQKELVYNDLAHQSWKNYNNKIADLKYKTDADYRKFTISDDPFVRDNPNFFDKLQLKYLNNKKNLTQTYYNALPVVDVLKGIYGDTDVWKAFGKNLFSELDPFSHYAIKGQEGEKVLESLKSTKVNPQGWENTSRAHINKYTDKLTRKETGGSIQTKQKKALSWINS